MTLQDLQIEMKQGERLQQILDSISFEPKKPVIEQMNNGNLLCSFSVYPRATMRITITAKMNAKAELEVFPCDTYPCAIAGIDKIINDYQAFSKTWQKKEDEEF